MISFSLLFFSTEIDRHESIIQERKRKLVGWQPNIGTFFQKNIRFFPAKPLYLYYR